MMTKISDLFTGNVRLASHRVNHYVRSIVTYH